MPFLLLIALPYHLQGIDVFYLDTERSGLASTGDTHILRHLKKGGLVVHIDQLHSDIDIGIAGLYVVPNQDHIQIIKLFHLLFTIEVNREVARFICRGASGIVNYYSHIFQVNNPHF